MIQIKWHCYENWAWLLLVKISYLKRHVQSLLLFQGTSEAELLHEGYRAGKQEWSHGQKEANLDTRVEARLWHRTMCETGLETGFLQSLLKIHQESRLGTAGTGDKYTYSIAWESKQGSDVNLNGPTCRIDVHGHCRWESMQRVKDPLCTQSPDMLRLFALSAQLWRLYFH